MEQGISSGLADETRSSVWFGRLINIGSSVAQWAFPYLHLAGGVLCIADFSHEGIEAGILKP
jgi:hypothetical protein